MIVINLSQETKSADATLVATKTNNTWQIDISRSNREREYWIDIYRYLVI